MKKVLGIKVKRIKVRLDIILSLRENKTKGKIPKIYKETEIQILFLNSFFSSQKIGIFYLLRKLSIWKKILYLNRNAESKTNR